MVRIASRTSLAALASLLALAACTSGDRDVTVSKMPAAEAAMAAARAEEAAVRSLEVLRRSFDRDDGFSAGCFDTFELDRAELCGDDYTAHLLFEWSDCLGTTGRILVDNVRDTVPAGGQCANPTGYTTSHVSAYDFAAALGNHGDHEVHVAVDASGTLSSDGSPQLMGSNVTVQALGLDSAGNLLYDAQVASDWALAWSGTNGSTVVADGTSSVHLTVTQRDYDVTATGLTFREDCCHPVAGTVSVAAMVAGTSWQATATFGPACGEATVDATPVTLAPCGP